MSRSIVFATIALAMASFSWPLRGNPVQFVVDVTSIQSQVASLAFDLFPGSPVPNNTTVISGFNTDGVLGIASPTGDFTGTLEPGPLTLGDSQFFNEWLQPIASATTLSFQLALSENVMPGIPDEFSFTLLDSTGNALSTSDPSGANALFFIDLTGATMTPQTYTSTFATYTIQPVSSVPEPFFVVVPALLIMLATGRALRFSHRKL
jgi:hypothetical protein